MSNKKDMQEVFLKLLRGLPDPNKLELLANWFDKYDSNINSKTIVKLQEIPNTEVQEDLRAWAAMLRILRVILNSKGFSI